MSHRGLPLLSLTSVLSLTSLLLLACLPPPPDQDAGGSGQDGGVEHDAATTSDAAADSDADSDAATGADSATTTDSSTATDSAAGQDAGPGADAGSGTPCDSAAALCVAGDVCRPNFETGWLECQPEGSVPIDGTCGAGGVDDCVAGAICIDFYGEGVASCHTICTFDTEFVPCPDIGQLCVPMWGQQDVGLCVGDNCTPPDIGCGAGERCSSFMGEVLACMPAGSVPEGGDCSVDYCQAGYGCTSDGDGGYVCNPLCDDTTDCDSGTHCEWSWEGIEDWGLCEAGCDMLTQIGCPASESCYYSDPETASTICWTTGTLPVGADCSAMANFCVPGSDCFADPESAPSYEYYCRAYCDDAHPCQSGTCQESPERIRGVKLCL